MTALKKYGWYIVLFIVTVLGALAYRSLRFHDTGYSNETHSLEVAKWSQ